MGFLFCFVCLLVQFPSTNIILDSIFFLCLFCIYQLIVQLFELHWKNYKTSINIIYKCSDTSDTLSVYFLLFVFVGLCLSLYLLPRANSSRILHLHAPMWTFYSAGPPYCHPPDFLFAFTLGLFFSVFYISSHV